MNLYDEAFRLMSEYFRNTKILSFDELSYLLQLHETQEDIKDWYDDFINLAYLDRLPKNTVELFIGHQVYFKVLSGETISLQTSLKPEHWQLHSEIICYKYKQDWNYSHPFVSFFLQARQATFRTTFIHHSLSPRKTSHLFFRTLSQKRFPISDYTYSISEEDFLRELIHSKSNILIAGATGSGKTSFISSLLEHIPETDHMILLEDTKEILPTANTTELIAENKPGKSLQALCEYSLRMSPDRLVIGEMRGAEVIPFLLMMNTGHSGLLSTIHANSAVEALHRCAFLFSMYGSQNSLDMNGSLKMITQNVEYVVYLEKRKITQIIKVLGSENQNCFFEEVRFDSQPLNSPELSRDFFV